MLRSTSVFKVYECHTVYYGNVIASKRNSVKELEDLPNVVYEYKMEKAQEMSAKIVLYIQLMSFLDTFSCYIINMNL